MDFIDELRLFAEKITSLKDHIQTEEATKISLVMPFIQLLGYNVFNPTEVIPEFTADVGIKKGEKVDYAIMKSGKPAILIEVKPISDDLSGHSSQLYRYFTTTDVRFAVLTNGFFYKFYSDLRKDNTLDETPFLEFDLLDIKDVVVPEIKKFHKESFDANSILSSASSLKYTTEIKKYISAQIKEPTDNFIRYFLREIYEGMATRAAIDKFKPIVKRALNQYVNDTVNEKIKAALEKDEKAPAKSLEEYEEEETGIVTTEDELEGFYLIKSMVRDIINPKRITHKDTKSYFGILIDGNIRKWICRLHFNNPKNRSIVIPDLKKTNEMASKKYAEIRLKIETLDDIYVYKSKIIDVLNSYLVEEKTENSQGV